VATSTTLTVRLSPQVKKHLSRLAGHTKRTESYLAAAAIADFVERELAFVEGIRRGLDDMQAGHVTPHEEAMHKLRATVAC
jgi:predicted transcriptional regulator